MRRILLVTAMVTAAGLSLVIGGASQALQTNLISNTATGDGGIVVIEILGQGTLISPPGYALVFNYSAAAFPGATSSINYAGGGDPYNGGDPNFDFGTPSVCGLILQDCQGANGGFLAAKGRQLTDSVSTFILTGLAGGTVVNWHTGNSTVVGGPSGSFVVIPEPAAAGLLAMGLIGLAFAGRRHS